jgi:cytoskeletal protein RodZ
MKEIGKILREKRKELGLDLEKAHRATKIQEKYILAIEDGDESAFAAEIYYKSFVKSYSKFLGLNGGDLLSRYEKRKSERSEGENDENAANSGKNKNRSLKQKSSKEGGGDLKKLFITVFIALFLCAAFLYLNKNISLFTDENPDRISVSEQKKIQLQKIQELQQQREREMRERQLGEVSVEDQKKTVEESNKALKPFPQRRESAAVRTAVQSSSGLNSVQKTNTAAFVKQQNDKQELEIVAVENVWIRVEGDGREIFQGTVVKGTKKNWKASEEFVVKIGYTPGVDVFFNGVEIEIDKGAVQDVNTLVLKRQQ